MLNRASSACESIGTLCRHIYEVEGAPLGINRILGVLSLAKKHGIDPVEKACGLALEVGAPTYRFVKRYINKLPNPPLSLRQVDPLIRQLTLYRDLIDRHQGDQHEHD